MELINFGCIVCIFWHLTQNWTYVFTLEGANGIKLALNQGIRVWRREHYHRRVLLGKWIQLVSTAEEASWGCSVTTADCLREHFTGSKHISEHWGLPLLHFQNGASSVYVGSQVILPPKGNGKEMYFWE